MVVPVGAGGGGGGQAFTSVLPPDYLVTEGYAASPMGPVRIRAAAPTSSADISFGAMRTALWWVVPALVAMIGGAHVAARRAVVAPGCRAHASGGRDLRHDPARAGARAGIPRRGRPPGPNDERHARPARRLGPPPTRVRCRRIARVAIAAGVDPHAGRGRLDAVGGRRSAELTARCPGRDRPPRCDRRAIS